MVLTTPVSYKKKHWLLPAQADATAAALLGEQLRVPALIAQLLFHRNITTPDQAQAFLYPQLKQLFEPALLPNINTAVDRIVQAISNNQAITLYGDYDVDGITGTAMLWHLLKAARANVSHYIPHRVDEGYGLSCGAIQTVIDRGANLIITIDCGVCGLEPIRLARSRGVDVIVTDHHEIPAELPPANAIVHPRLPGSLYPNADLCGAGVAFKLAWAIASKLCGGGKVNEVYRNLLVEFTALVALATIADVVPLTGENRILARFGLQQVARSTFTGIQALITSAGYAQKKVDSTAVGFGLAPRLNAAGRMGHADLAVELLTTAPPERAAEIADYLEDQNGDRQATERKMVTVAKKQVEAWDQLPLVIVVCSETNHAGVVGIVASRLVETYHRPTFVLTYDDELCHGSARSIAGFELHHAIQHCRDLLTSGGGHAMAGGIKLPRGNLDAFIRRVNEYAAGILHEEYLVPSLPVDGIMRLEDAQVQAVKYLEQFEPFGRGNPRPRFLIQAVRISAPPRRVGVTGAHLQLSLSQDGHQCRAIAFKMGAVEPSLHVGLEVDLVVEPKLDEFNGNHRCDLHVVDMARSDQQAFPATPLAIDAA
jgi:single-stranded-DNA-specific exonuclease